MPALPLNRPRHTRCPLPAALVLALAASLAACGGGGSDSSASTTATPSTKPLSSQAALGEKIFNDATLSASGQQSCASCHASTTGFGQDNALAAQLGGPHLDLQGGRVSPPIGYLAYNTAFHFDAEGTPVGGFFWDGRARSLADQAGKPFLNPVEMANASEADVIARLSRASYAADFRQAHGSDIFDRPAEAFRQVTLALQQFQLESPAFAPFSSKFDEYLRGNTPLTAQEARGLALFNNPDKGNCAACHPSDKGSDGSHPLFTDFSYDNLGVPRNPELARNADPTFFDLGLCTQDGGALATRTDLCGAFKVPSLRNAALRRAFFHNGRFKNLKDVVTFYVQRDTHPEKFYSLNTDGTVNLFDDLPAAHKGNVNTTEAPYNRTLGEAPALSDDEIADVVAFLGTLTDGWNQSKAITP